MEAIKGGQELRKVVGNMEKEGLLNVEALPFRPYPDDTLCHPKLIIIRHRSRADPKSFHSIFLRLEIIYFFERFSFLSETSSKAF